MKSLINIVKVCGLLLSVVLLTGCHTRYEAGDCFVANSSEFDPDPLITKVLERGKYNYRYKIKFTFMGKLHISEGVGPLIDSFNNTLEHETSKVECPKELF